MRFFMTCTLVGCATLGLEPNDVEIQQTSDGGQVDPDPGSPAPNELPDVVLVSDDGGASPVDPVPDVSIDPIEESVEAIRFLWNDS